MLKLFVGLILFILGVFLLHAISTVAILFRSSQLSKREVLTEDEMLSEIDRFEKKHNVEVVIACGPSDVKENADNLLASYNIAEDTVYWSALPETVNLSAVHLGVSPKALIRIILSHEFGHKDTPSYMNSLYRAGFTHWSDMEREAWKLGVRYISFLDYPLYFNVGKQITEQMNSFYESYHAS